MLSAFYNYDLKEESLRTKEGKWLQKFSHVVRLLRGIYGVYRSTDIYIAGITV